MRSILDNTDFYQLNYDMHRYESHWYFFCPFLFTFWNFHYAYFVMLDGIPQVFKVFFILFHSFFLFLRVDFPIMWSSYGWFFLLLTQICYWAPLVNVCPILEKAMAPHSNTLAWKIPWMKEPGRLQCMWSLRVGHDWATSLSLFTFMHWRRKWQPTPVFLPGESQGWGSLVGCCLWGRTESDTTEAT